jgi:hypothetical protein
MEPDLYQAARDSSRYGTMTEGKLLSGIAGHNICLDYFGSPSSDEVELGYSQHGEAPNSRWTIEGYSANTACAKIKLKVGLPAAGLQLQREITLFRDESVVYFNETITNERRLDHFFHWTQHVTLGRPFLCPESTISISGSKGITSPFGYDEGKALLAPGRIFPWPNAPRAKKGVANLSQPFSHAGYGYVVGVLSDPLKDVGFIGAVNSQERLLFGYCFSRSNFPWITVWEENLAIEAAPWKRRTQALGLEFGTTPLPTGRRENFQNGGPIFGTPTNTFIPALGKKSVRYMAFLARVPEGFERLHGVEIGRNEILLFGSPSHLPVRLPASRIVEALQVN